MNKHRRTTSVSTSGIAGYTTWQIDARISSGLGSDVYALVSLALYCKHEAVNSCSGCAIIGSGGHSGCLQI